MRTRAKKRSGRVAGIAALVILTVALAQQARQPIAAQTAKPAGGDTRRTPVLVELFTSEGCSSCPPADALLARLDQTQPVPGAEVIALEQHVDYWDQLGWRDPFSSAQMSARQNDYAFAFRHDSVYTPQMIVDGRTEFVGSAENRARATIARAAATPKAPAYVRLRPRRPGEKVGAISLEVRVDPLAEATPGDTPEVYLAITESRLQSDVARGENAGRHLEHSGVVRELRRIGTAEVRGASAFAAEPAVRLDSGWKRENLRAVIFVQERASRHILAAAAIPLPAQ